MQQPDPPAPHALNVPDLHWRLGTTADVPAVARFAALAFDPAYREAWSETQLSGMMADRNSWLELAEVEGEATCLAAFALSRLIVDEVELLLCATAADARRQGLGSSLIRQVCSSARTRGAGRIFLEVRASNIAARSLYESIGFSPAGRRPGYYKSVAGESIDAITLSLSLMR